MGTITVEQMVSADGFATGDGEAEVLGDGPVAAARAMLERHRSAVVWGSLRPTDALLHAGLVDELRLRVVPVLVGTGRTVAPTAAGMRALALRDVERHDTGHLTRTDGFDGRPAGGDDGR